MSPGASVFTPCRVLLPGFAAPSCHAVVTLPARNEEKSLTRCLDSLRAQRALDGSSLPLESFEVLLLLNNCTDRSVEVAHRWQAANPDFPLHVLVAHLTPEEAHVGTARRLLMDTAWCRLLECREKTAAILSTDADSVVGSDWITANLRALQRGADVVGGRIHLLPRDLRALPSSVRRCYEQDRVYAALIAQLEDMLDPQPGDDRPRHLDHFGSSLACTPQAYARAGGMPALSSLEDEAFVDRVRRANLVLRHDPTVCVYTSARLEGRASVGMAGQLRLWTSLKSEADHKVSSAAFLVHRFRMLRSLRQIFAIKELGEIQLPTEWWRQTFADALRDEDTCPGFLAAVYCDILIAESFQGQREEPIRAAIEQLQNALGEFPGKCAGLAEEARGGRHSPKTGSVEMSVQ